MMFFLNRRFKESDDNFTSVSCKGKSVVDYICIQRDNYVSCKFFQVISPSSLVDRYSSYDYVGERSKLRNHYMLKCQVQYQAKTCVDSQTSTPTRRTQCKNRKYKHQAIPEDFLSSELVLRALSDLIRRIQTCRGTQQNIGSVYDQFCDTLIREMNDTIPSWMFQKSRKAL